MTENSTEYLGSSEVSAARAKRCVTHSYACDCREYRSEQMRAALERIRELASSHCDLAVDEADTSPDDQVSHVNGLIVRECNEALQ